MQAAPAAVTAQTTRIVHNASQSPWTAGALQDARKERSALHPKFQGKQTRALPALDIATKNVVATAHGLRIASCAERAPSSTTVLALTRVQGITMQRYRETAADQHANRATRCAAKTLILLQPFALDHRQSSAPNVAASKVRVEAALQNALLSFGPPPMMQITLAARLEMLLTVGPHRSTATNCALHATKSVQKVAVPPVQRRAKRASILTTVASAFRRAHR